MSIYIEDLWSLVEFFRTIENTYTLSIDENFTVKDLEKLKSRLREKLEELLLPRIPIEFREASIDEVSTRDSVVVEKISYRLPYGVKVEGFFLYPEDRGGEKLPAVLALHDHGGFKYYGKERLVEFPGEPEVLKEYRSKMYSSRSWAVDLAKMGFAVLAVDTFLFGSRRVRSEIESRIADLNEVVKKYNEEAYRIENIVAKTLYSIGLSVIGVIVYEDLVSLKYLLSRKEVDPSKIGSCGASLGGLRSLYLSALDERVRCSVVVASMSSIDEILKKGIEHAWTLYISNMVKYFDFPDLILLHAPQPLMIQYCINDRIFPYEGQLKAHRKIQNIYRKYGYENNYTGIFYDKPHVFDVEMQKDAFSWLNRCLKL